ncbi:MAG: DUF1801 domain-containing protein [Boseongicola sp.]
MKPTGPQGDVKKAFAAVPGAPRQRLLQMRTLIFDAAAATETEPLTETLKWGQPAYLPARRHGTTIRLGWAPSDPENCKLFVHCQTDLIGRYRQFFPDEFRYDANRAVLVPATGSFAEPALQQIAAMALTYHRDKRSRSSEIA